MLLIALALAPFLQSPEQEPARRALERSLAFLEKEGTAWIKERACLSCHHVPFLLWSHREAKERGVAVDPKKLAEWTEWSRKESLAQRALRVKLTEPALETLKADGLPAETLARLAPFPKKPGAREADFVKELAKALPAEELAAHQEAILKRAVREKGEGGGIDTMAQLILGGAYGADDAAFTASTRVHLGDLRREDGSWKPAGQLMALKRSADEAIEVTTMGVMLAQDPVEPKTLEFVKRAKPGATNEWLALRMLVEERFGESGTFQSHRKELASRQNGDGGWAWLHCGPSDAFATGQVLYAMTISGPIDPAAAAKARRFLIDSQREDGSWAIVGMSAKPRPSKDPIYRYWGTAWAAIGLARTLP